MLNSIYCLIIFKCIKEISCSYLTDKEIYSKIHCIVMSKRRTHVDLETNLLWWNDPCSWADWWTAKQTPWNTLGAWKCHQQPPPHQGFARVILRCHCYGRSEKYLKYQQAYRLTEQCRRMAEVCGSFVNISEIIGQEHWSDSVSYDQLST